MFQKKGNQKCKIGRGREKSNGDPKIKQVANLKSLQCGTLIIGSHVFDCVVTGKRVNERTINVFFPGAMLFYCETLFLKSMLVHLH